MRAALDATYSLDRNLSGVGVYSRRILFGLAQSHPEALFFYCYRPHRWLGAFRETIHPNCRRRPLLERWAPKADLFHGLNQRLPAAHLNRAVATFHDLFVLSGDYSTPEFRHRFAEQARQAAARADLIIAVSEFTAGQVRDLLGVSPERIRVIYHGATCRVPVGPDPPLLKEDLILTVGALQKRKNTMRLVEAFERSAPGWKLALAGSYGFGAGEILERIASSPRRREIEVHGYVSEQRLNWLYQRASIFAFPSLDEGFGMPVLDAMASGIAVLTSNRSATAEVGGDAVLLVDPEDTDSIAAGLQRLSEDPHLRDELALRGRRRASAFRWERAVDQTWSVYQELLR
ncbi:MAG: glycosyltransferase family 4 protein [Bryobacteraceae bacterium]